MKWSGRNSREGLRLGTSLPACLVEVSSMLVEALSAATRPLPCSKAVRSLEVLACKSSGVLERPPLPSKVTLVVALHLAELGSLRKAPIVHLVKFNSDRRCRSWTDRAARASSQRQPRSGRPAGDSEAHRPHRPAQATHLVIWRTTHHFVNPVYVRLKPSFLDFVLFNLIL